LAGIQEELLRPFAGIEDDWSLAGTVEGNSAVTVVESLSDFQVELVWSFAGVADD